jgi:hypothetical protein
MSVLDFHPFYLGLLENALNPSSKSTKCSLDSFQHSFFKLENLIQVTEFKISNPAAFFRARAEFFLAPEFVCSITRQKPEMWTIILFFSLLKNDKKRTNKNFLQDKLYKISKPIHIHCFCKNRFCPKIHNNDAVFSYKMTYKSRVCITTNNALQKAMVII